MKHLVRTPLLSIALFTLINLPLRADPIYFRILNVGHESVQINYTGLYPNAHKITDNKSFWNKPDLIQMDYRSSDNDYIQRVVNSQYSENQKLRQINPCGFVSYKIDSKNTIHDLQIELRLNKEAVKNGIRLEVSKNKAFPDSVTIRLDTSCFNLSGDNLKMDAFIDFATLMTAYNGEKWSGSEFADRFGMAECYWYGYVKPFSHGAKVDYWKYNSTCFFMDGKLKSPAEDGYFGVDLEWRQELQKGYEYIVTTVVGTPPDYILINNKKVVWQKESGFYAASSGELVFYYTPDENEKISISYVKNATKEISRLDLDTGYQQELYCTRRPAKEPVQYSKFSIEKEFVPIEHFTMTMHPSYHDDPVPSLDLEKLPELPYPVADFKITPRGALAARNQIMDAIEKLDIRDAVFTLDLSGDRYFQPEDFTVFRDAGVKNMDFLVFEKQNGKIAKINPHWHSNQLYDSNPVNTTADLMKQWLDQDSSHLAYLHFQEVNCLFGAWGKNIFNNDVLSDYGYTNLEGKSVQEMFQLHIDEISAFSDRMEEKIGSPEKVKRLLLPDRAVLNPAYWVKAGADIVVMKNIHRQSVNLVTSGARGMAEAYGIEYGFDEDLWDRCTRLGYHPDEFKQVYMVYFHSSGKYIIEEGMPQAPDYGTFSIMGKYWIDMARYARVHPPLGDQVVQIAVMRGFGDEWHTVGSPSSSWESGYYEKTVNGENYLKDFNLLNNLFSNYGTYWNTAPDRLCTGTPYGPVDFIPWEAPLEILKKYKLIVIMGFNTLEEEHMNNLAEYVHKGGKVICAAGQIKSVDGTFSPTTELFGVVTGETNGISTVQRSLIPDKKTLEYTTVQKVRPYYVLDLSGESADIVEFLPDQSPLLVKNTYGQGTTYLFSGEHLTEFGEELPAQIMKNELEELKPISMAPFSDRIEYMVRRKGNSIILPVFNHGNAGFPSGNFYAGDWTGRLIIEKDLLGIAGESIAVYRAVYDEKNMQVDLEKIPSTDTGDQLIFDAMIDTFKEYVIGPELHAKNDFYR